MVNFFSGAVPLKFYAQIDNIRKPIIIGGSIDRSRKKVIE